MKAIKDWSPRSKEISAFIGMMSGLLVGLFGLAILRVPNSGSISSLLVDVGIDIGATIIAGIGFNVFFAFNGILDKLSGGSGKTIIDRLNEVLTDD